mgnify:CR=1 FL=1
MAEATKQKQVSIMCFHDELCQVFNALMTALNLLRQGARVTVFFGSRGVNAIHRAKMPELRCLPDLPEMGEAVMKRMDELELPLLEDLSSCSSPRAATCGPARSTSRCSA